MKTLYSLIWDIFRSGLSIKLLMHLAISIIFETILSNWLTIKANRMIVDDANITGGIALFMLDNVISMIGKYHRQFLDKEERKFRNNSHEYIQHIIDKKFTSLYWNELRELDVEINEIIDKTKWPILSFMSNIMSNFINILPIISKIICLTYISPLSIVWYIFCLGIVFKFSKSPVEKTKDNFDLWDKYSFLRNEAFCSVIHHQDQRYIKDITNCVKTIENNNAKQRLDESRYIDKLHITFYAITIGSFILAILLDKLSNSVLALLYIQYSNSIGNLLFMIGRIYQQYLETKSAYNILEQKLFCLEEKPTVKQIKNVESIKMQFNYTYSTNDSDSIPFQLIIPQPIIITQKKPIILLNGSSGNGKSTLMDIISGVIPSRDLTKRKIWINNQLVDKGFDAITEARVYIEQTNSCYYKPCVFDIITGLFDSEKNVIASTNTEKTVWNALEMANCQDFLKLTNDTNDERRWIYSKNIMPSGGQKVRISIARIFYKILINQPSIVILDEIDRSIQANMAVSIMNGIHNYCRQNNIICIVSAHLTEVKQLNYDLILNCNKGIVTVL
jgi:ABC-type lipoprotein export system ATPase subunit